MPIAHANGVKALVVLVVEDEFLVRCRIVGALRDAGYSVVETGSGEEAVAHCKPHASIDVVFTDINLGGLVSGWDVADCFRGKRPNVAVVYTSGAAVETERRCAGSIFFAKPYQTDEIVSACDQLCGK